MEYEVVLATTHPVNRGSFEVQFTKEALERGLSQFNGTFAIPMITNHDPLCMPLGKLKSAWLTQLEDDEWAVCARVYEDTSPVTLILDRHTGEDGRESMVALTFSEDKRPFIPRHRIEPTTLSVVADRVNFRDPDSFESFRSDLLQDYEDVSMGEVGRHELIPEPLIEFLVNHFSIWSALQWTAGGWFLYRLEKPCSYVIDETLREAADGVVDSIRPKIRRIFKRFQERPNEDERKTLVGIHLNGSPAVRLYARIGADDTFPDINLPEIMETLNRYSNFMVNAQEVVLEWADGGWHFRFAISNEGEVVATADCFNYTTEAYKRILEASRNLSEDATRDD